MPKEPLITRSELRRRKEEEEAAHERNQKIIAKQSSKELQQKEKQIDNHYRKIRKKNKDMTKTRAGENQKSRDLNRFLMKGIVIVGLLLIVVGLAVFLL
ncbi:cell wall synthase accessory phosphoprotein MacP [Enterococcus sp. DIV0876]|uniref:cell wall synthase accessory phosphoprotein MacP n=1 Tax=Enterococcus sp. DIV0876 TaxID=2774633 RepID=UPI003D300D92